MPQNNNNQQWNLWKEFIAVSKKCCYLCELYINFAWKQRYDITILKYYNKIYSRWKLLLVKDDNFKISFLRYILENLNQIIGQKLEYYTRSLSTGPDSDRNSSNPSSSDGGYMDAPFKKASKKVKRTDPLFDEWWYILSIKHKSSKRNFIFLVNECKEVNTN